MSDKLTKNYYETDFKTFVLSYPGQSLSDDSDDPDYFRDSSQSQSFSQSSHSSSQSQSFSQSSQSTQSSSSEGCGDPSPKKESSQ